MMSYKLLFCFFFVFTFKLSIAQSLAVQLNSLQYTLQNNTQTKSQIESLINISNTINSKTEAGYKAWYLKLLITYKDNTLEDTFYFANSKSIDSLLHKNDTEQSFKAYLHVLQYERLINFKDVLYKTNYSNNRQMLFKHNYLVNNYAAFTLDSLSGIAHSHLDTALLYFKTNTNENIEEYLWLCPKAYQLVFKPNVYDVISFYGLQNDEAYRRKYLDFYADDKFLLYNEEAFEKFILDTAISSKNSTMLINWYNSFTSIEKKQGLQWYLKIEKLVKANLSVEEYDTILSLLAPYTVSNIESVKVATLFCKSIILQKMASLYQNQSFNCLPRNNEFRLSQIKWLDLFEENKNLFKKYAFLYNDFINKIDEVKKPSININIATPTASTDSISIRFANIENLYVAITAENDKNNSIVLSLPPNRTFRLDSFKITTNDYQVHIGKIALLKLPEGNYKLKYANKPFKGVDTLKLISGEIDFQISNLALIQLGNQLHSINRTTGMPIADIPILFYNVKDSLLFKTKTNAKGKVRVNAKYNYALGYYNNCFIKTQIESLTKNNYYTDIKSEEETLQEFYEDHIKLNIYTDRAIYKPGQTVYFKGILFTKDPYNGNDIPLTIKNIKLGVFKKLALKAKLLFNKQKLRLYINDDIGKSIDTISVFPNKYGSFSGAYTLKKNAVLGEYDFEVDDLDLDFDIELNNGTDGTFKVEEYKRPTYEVTIERPADTIKFGNAFLYRIKVKSFSGASLQNVKVAYSLKGDYYLYGSDYNLINDSNKNNLLASGVLDKLAFIKDSFGYTNVYGVFEIPVQKMPIRYSFLSKQEVNFRASVNCTVTDQTDEQYEASQNYNITNRPIILKNNCEKVFSSKETFISTLKLSSKTMALNFIKVKCIIKKTNVDTVKEQMDFNFYNNNLKVLSPVVKQNNEYVVFDTILKLDKIITLYKSLQNYAAGKYTIYFQAFNADTILSNTISTVFEILSEKVSFNDFEKSLVINTYTEKSLALKCVSAPNDIHFLYAINFIIKNNKGFKRKTVYNTHLINKGDTIINISLPKHVYNEANFSMLFIKNNADYTFNKTVEFPRTEYAGFQFEIEKFKTVLEPGRKEEFTLKIKTKDKKRNYELLTSMYDASLDAIEPSKWNINRIYNIRTNQINANFNLYSNNTGLNTVKNYFIDSFSKQTIWWNLLNYKEASIFKNASNSNNIYNKYDEAILVYSKKLEEVVVVGYGGVKENNFVTIMSSMGVLSSVSSIPGASTRINVRGFSSLTSNSKALTILDGKEISESEFAAINIALINDIVVLKTAEATALYGSRGNNGVIVMSTTGRVELPKIPEPEIAIRSNFKETAFFYPYLKANRKGIFTINFTMPETATKWKWRSLLHSKKGLMVYKENFINTQLPLMVQPYLPSVLYQADSIAIPIRIINLKPEAINGTVNLQINDVQTGKDITELFTTKTNKLFNCNAATNTVASFDIKVPENWKSQIKITVKAKTENYSDGEAYTLPIISKQMFTSRALQIELLPNADTTILLPKLTNGIFAIGTSLVPNGAQNLIQATSYLTNYTYECAEQLTSKLMGNIMALQLLKTYNNKMPNIEDLTDAELEALPGDDALEAMPWLKLQNQQILNKKLLRSMLDSQLLKNNLKTCFNKLNALQHANGGLMWFAGGDANPEISVLVLQNLSKMNVAFYFKDNIGYTNFFNALYTYCNINFNTDKNINLNFIIAKGYFLKQTNAPFKQDSIIEKYITEQWLNYDNLSLQNKAQLCIASRLYNANYFNAKIIAGLDNIVALAANDTLNGMRWKIDADNSNLFTNSFETTAWLGEALDYPNYNANAHEGIAKWLLNAKANNYWQSTKTTAQVLQYLLQGKAINVNKYSMININLQNKNKTITNNLFEPSAYHYETIANNFDNKMYLKNTSSEKAKANIILYYFETPSNKIKETLQSYTITKQLKIWRNNKWQNIVDSSSILVGDKIQTQLIIQTPKALSYVFVNDKRGACLEPINEKSGSNYSDGLRFYQNIRFASTDIFAEYIPAGTSTIIYESKVTHAGQFTNGAVSMQCMYKPEITAVSTQNELKVLSSTIKE